MLDSYIHTLKQTECTSRQSTTHMWRQGDTLLWLLFVCMHSHDISNTGRNTPICFVGDTTESQDQHAEVTNLKSILDTMSANRYCRYTGLLQWWQGACLGTFFMTSHLNTQAFNMAIKSLEHTGQTTQITISIHNHLRLKWCYWGLNLWPGMCQCP